MPYKPIDTYPVEEQEAELERRRELRRIAKQKSRERQRAAGKAPRKDTRVNRSRPDMAEYMRKKRAKNSRST